MLMADVNASSTTAPGHESTDGPRFIIGIDLGTTNSAVSYVDLSSPAHSRAIAVFEVSQLTDAGRMERLPVLPSFLYIPGEFDVDADAVRHPWAKTDDAFV
ncbi:MAG: hypothetical protein KJP07_09475, partial [Desulfatitalea sp.]|nr:hypothetical protein [Desulfatitalea sp.]